MTDSAEQVRQFYAHALRLNWLERYRAYRTQHSDIPCWLQRDALPSLRQSQHRQGLPSQVLEAYDFYDAHVMRRDLGTVQVARIEAGDRDTFAVFVTTDGDDGWLEIFDRQGQLLGAARTYIELVAWAPQSQIRATVLTGDFPPELGDRMERTLWGKPLAEIEEANGDL